MSETETSTPTLKGDHPTPREIISEFSPRVESIRWELRYGDDVREANIVITLAPGEAGTAA